MSPTQRKKGTQIWCFLNPHLAAEGQQGRPILHLDGMGVPPMVPAEPHTSSQGPGLAAVQR